ncbi:hypothetical protein BDR26DRAFT_922997 [Obelidium mucronatum]|nr:hypothetical protein BDR26DRAFT_922997 [Obelidium mucronatum]
MKRIIRSTVSSADSNRSQGQNIKVKKGLTQLAPETDAPMISLVSSEPNTLCSTPATLSSTDVVNDILKRQEDWETERAELDLYLQKVKEVVSTGNATLISNEIQDLDAYESALMERNKHETDETRHKILDGFRKIKLLDSILTEKTLLAESFSSKPSTSHETIVNSKPHTTETSIHSSLSNYKEDSTRGDDDTSSITGGGTSEADFELRSVHSLDTRTFLTEPKLLARKKLNANGSQRRSAGALRQQPSITSQEQLEQVPLGPDGKPIAEKKGYKLGDFIQRNIVLGPQARFYHAMTEVEQDRVNRILGQTEDELGAVDEDDDDYDDPDSYGLNLGLNEGEFPDEIASTAHSARKSHHSNTRPANTWLDPTELDRLAKIDQELVSLYGDDNKDVASLIWTPSVWTPSASGISTPMYPPSSARDVQSVLALHALHDDDENPGIEGDSSIAFQNSADRIMHIDQQLRKLHEKRIEKDNELESHERLEELLDQIRATHEF